MTRVMVLWCLDWPVVSAGVDARTPAAMVASGRVTACTAAAREAGVRRGQKLRDAQRHCPQLILHAEDPDAQARAFEPVIAVVESLCPRVEVIRPGLVAVPARGPSRYYGREQAAADTIRDAVTSAGLAGRELACAVGVADGSFAAMLAARVPPTGVVVPTSETAAFLAQQPVSVLGSVESAGLGAQRRAGARPSNVESGARPDSTELAGVLIRLGIRTLGELAALPAGDVLARFGPDGGAAHRLARGLAARPPATRRPGEDLSVVHEFDPPSGAEPVVFVAKSLAGELHEKLAARGLAGVRVEVEVTTSDGASWTRLWRHDGLLSDAALAERVRWQLDAWRTGPRTPGAGSGAGRRGSRSAAESIAGGVSRLRLAPDQLVVDAGRQLALWGADTISDRIERAASRIQVMLGHAGVTRPVLAGGRGPAERVVKVPWGDRLDAATTAADRPWPGRVPEPAPAVVPPEPRPVSVLAGDGSTVMVSGRCVISARPVCVVVDGEELQVSEWTGPWPARELWWDAAQARRQARFQVTTDDGRALLLLIDRGQWFIEGTYD